MPQVTTGPRLVLICGLPGAGKTTVAIRLAQESAAVRLSGDEWMSALGIDLHDEAVRDRLEVLFWQLAQELLRLGQSVILESGFWLRSDRDEKRIGAQAMGVVVEFHFLVVPFDERWGRIDRRNSLGAEGTVFITREQLASWELFFEPPDSQELALFDIVVLDRPDDVA
jgi:predicted kinase